MLGFKDFLFNEEKSFLGHRVGDVLTAVQDLQTDIEGMGLRQITRIAEDIVNQIRKILHSDWSPSQTHYLKDLQKVAVALMKAIEEKDDLKEIVPQMGQKLQDISAKLGQKTNNLKGQPEPSGPDAEEAPMELTGQGPGAPPGGQLQLPPPQPGMPPQA